MAQGFTIKLHWYNLGTDDSPRWDYDRALYAYLAPARPVIYYVGKCYGTTVRERYAYDAKSAVWDCVDKQTKNNRPIVAEFVLPDGMNISKELVTDIECLLIYRLQPSCNVQCKSSRGKYRRSGMRVVCFGKDWPLSEREFRDEG
jgi:hypothetical protein